MGDLVIVTLEGDDPEGVFGRMMSAGDAFATWFIERAKAFHDLDLTVPMTELHWKLTQVERPRLVEAKSTGSMTATMFARFEPAAGGTDVTLGGDYEVPLRFVGEAADKLVFERSVVRDTEQSLKNFKAIVEAEAPVHA